MVIDIFIENIFPQKYTDYQKATSFWFLKSLWSLKTEFEWLENTPTLNFA